MDESAKGFLLALTMRRRRAASRSAGTVALLAEQSMMIASGSGAAYFSTSDRRNDSAGWSRDDWTDAPRSIASLLPAALCATSAVRVLSDNSESAAASTAAEESQTASAERRMP
jgi:hypothetical protein